MDEYALPQVRKDEELSPENDWKLDLFEDYLQNDLRSRRV